MQFRQIQPFKQVVITLFKNYKKMQNDLVATYYEMDYVEEFFTHLRCPISVKWSTVIKKPIIMNESKVR